MAGFFLCRDDARASARLADARAQFARHGFGTPTPIAAAGWTGFHIPYIDGGPATWLSDGDDFAAAVGTLRYRRQLGELALAAMLRDAPALDPRHMRGEGAALIRKDGALRLTGDAFGAFQIFHDDAFDVLSTSFLCLIRDRPRLEWDAQGVYEFTFGVFPTGEDTVFEGIKRLPAGTELELAPAGAKLTARRPLLPDGPDGTPVEALVGLTVEELRDAAQPFVRHYGDNIQCPLSGGLDSRLALAVLRDAGVRPHIYIYGRPGEPEVEIARAIAQGEGFDLEICQKAAFRDLDPLEYAAQVETNFHEGDALVTDGALFDNGGNTAARHARSAGGALAVSGGCGEVLRNFFYLPDRPMPARALADSFFARCAPGDVTPRFDRARFVARLEAKALAALGHEGDRSDLPRGLIEQLYPRMRCRAFFGRELSLVSRRGGYFMPFFDRDIVETGLRVPLADKDAGAFEARVLARLDPRLARYPSAYGHAFDVAPSAAHRLGEAASRNRPLWARRYAYPLRRALGALDDGHGGLLSPIYLGQVIDLHFPHMRAFFRPEKVGDNGVYRRIASLEYIGRTFAEKLPATDDWSQDDATGLQH
jgi:asparagine synthase (glutamine-hydrolysing)